MKQLIIAPAWVGDMIMAQSLFLFLSRRHLNGIIDVIAPKSTFPLLSRMPQVRRALSLPLGHGELGLGIRRSIGKSLRAEQYDQAIILTNSFKSALIPWFAHIPKRTSWPGECRWGLINDARPFDAKVLPRMAQRFLWLGVEKHEELPALLPTPSLVTDNPNPLLASLQLSLKQPVLALCPGAEYGPAKRWPPEYFAAVAKTVLAQGVQVWVFGGPKDIEIGERIASESGAMNLAGKTSLLEAVDLLACANAVITNDSGLMHVAAALQRPLIAIYGSSSPEFTPPMSDRVKILSLNLSCSPCFKRECPLDHLNCLRELKPERVLQALGELCVF